MVSVLNAITKGESFDASEMLEKKSLTMLHVYRGIFPAAAFTNTSDEVLEVSVLGTTFPCDVQ